MANEKADTKANEKADTKANEKAESVNLADVKKQVEEMLAKAQHEADLIIMRANAKAKGELTEAEKKVAEERKAYWNELVPVELFKDNNKYKDDVFVSVNDETCQIKRGEKVMIKRKFHNVLESSRKQDLETSRLIDKKSSEFANAKF